MLLANLLNLFVSEHTAGLSLFVLISTVGRILRVLFLFTFVLFDFECCTAGPILSERILASLAIGTEAAIWALVWLSLHELIAVN